MYKKILQVNFFFSFLVGILAFDTYAQRPPPPPPLPPIESIQNTTETTFPPASITHDLRFGMQDDEVSILQISLQSLRYFPDTQSATGYFGTLTKNAVIAFQADQGIPATGFVGPLTRAALNVKVLGKEDSITMNLGVGNSGRQVYLLQDKLSTLGYFSQKATGYFGIKTRLAVMAYQQANGIPATGFVGPLTRAALNVNGLILPPPFPTSKCTSDADCPSTRYTCEPTLGTGTICSSDDPSCVPTSTIIVEGICRLREGSWCQASSECAEGRLCYANVCTNPNGNRCSGPNDVSCPSGYECVQGCGSPVPRPNEPPPPYYCALKEYSQSIICPICLAESTMIDTLLGSILVKDLRVGMFVWTSDKNRNRIAVPILKTSKTPVPPVHEIVHLTLSDGRALMVSPGHPTADGRKLGNLAAGDTLDGSIIVSVKRMPYEAKFTYDILPAGETGAYWANGVLIGSTLK